MILEKKYESMQIHSQTEYVAQGVPENDQPVVHSYRVFSIRDGAKSLPETRDDSRGHGDGHGHVKPILMCFICKLSFGFAKSFEGHCTGEHGVELSREEREALQSNANCSAIIQGRLNRCFSRLQNQ